MESIYLFIYYIVEMKTKFLLLTFYIFKQHNNIEGDQGLEYTHNAFLMHFLFVVLLYWFTIS